MALLNLKEGKIEKLHSLDPQKLKQVLDLMPDGVCIVGDNFEIEYANEALKRYFGEIKGKKCYQYFHGLETPCVNCGTKERGSDKECFFEENYPRAGKNYEVFTIKLDNNKNKKTSLLQVFHDVTGQRKTEKALHYIRLVTENSLDIIYGLNMRTKCFDYVSPTIEKISGFTQKEYYGMGTAGTSKRVHPDDRPKMRTTLKRAIASGSGSVEYRFMKKNGEYRWMDNHYTIVSDSNGQPNYCVGIVRDIDSRKKTEEALSQEVAAKKLKESNLKNYIKYVEREKAKDMALLDSIGDGVLAIDTEGKILFVNNAFLNLVSKNRQEVEGRNVNESIYLYDEKGNPIPQREKPYALCLKSKRKIYFGSAGKPKIYITKGKNQIPLSINSTPIIFKDEIIGVISIYRDVSLATEIDKAKTEFISMAAHQLRTPLSTMSLSTEMLLKGFAGKLDREAKKYLKDFYKEVQTMNHLVKTFLSVSRLDLGTMPINMSLVEPAKIMNEAIKKLWQQIKKKNLIVKRFYGKELPKIKTDPKILAMVFENILTNSIKYTPKDGFINISIDAGNPELIIKISDTGYGIPEKAKTKIFTKLYRAKNALPNEGTGLGLYIAKYSLDKVGGRIWFDSEENKGTTFYVALPSK